MTHQRYVLRGGIELIRRNHCRNRLTARGIVFSDVGLLVQAALDNFRRIFEILTQLFFGQIEDFQLHVLAKVSLVHQGLKATPHGLHFLERVIVHDFIKLAADLEIQFSDMVVE